MWRIDVFPESSQKDTKTASELRELIVNNELGNTRLPDFVALSHILGKPCLPFREHDVHNYTKEILEALCDHEQEMLAFDNPLYDGSADRVFSIDISNSVHFKSFEIEDLFSAAFILFTPSLSFVWIGNYTDYGFMFAELKLIEKIFCAGALTTYCTRTCDLRFNFSGDDVLDKEVAKLDHVWLDFLRSH